ncbi:MAG: hypothetical protein OEX12_02680 [Gammaproteobacteria bacterium]|nr:hypothetical protein [Gammaproteobacteria bacterium]
MTSITSLIFDNMEAMLDAELKKNEACCPLVTWQIAIGYYGTVTDLLLEVVPT